LWTDLEDVFMKSILMTAAAVFVLAACGGGEAPATTAETPAAGETPAAAAAPMPATPTALTGPAAGMWRMTMTSQGMNMPPTEICYEKQMTMEDAQALQSGAGVECSENTFNATPGGMTGHSVCKMGDMTMTSDTKVIGDFNTAYTVELTSSMSPAPAGMPSSSVTTIKMERLGDCT
jgi:hypothetical protein